MTKNMKKMKGVSLSPSLYGVVDQEEAKRRFKHQSLFQDFAELEKETELTKKRLQKAKRKRLTLLAEVRFLRRRYEYLINNPPQETPSESLIPLQNAVNQRQVAAKERNYIEKDSMDGRPYYTQVAAKERNYIEKDSMDGTGRPYTHLDLNLTSLHGGEAAGVVHPDWEPLRVNKKLKRCSTTEELLATTASNLDFSICGDVENGSSRSMKRRVSWQDPVALRV